MAPCRVLVFGAPNAGKTYLLNGLVGKRQFDFKKDGEQVYEDKAQRYTFVEVGTDYCSDKIAERLESEAPQMPSCVFVVKPDNDRLSAVDGAVMNLVAARADVPKLQVVMPMGPKVLGAFKDDVYRRYCAPPEHLDKVHLYPLLIEKGFDDESAAVPRLPGNFQFVLHDVAEPTSGGDVGRSNGRENGSLPMQATSHQTSPEGRQPLQQEVGPSFQEGVNTILKGFSDGFSMMGRAATQHAADRRDAATKSVNDQHEVLAQQMRDSIIGQYASTAAIAVQQFDSTYQISGKVDQHVLAPAREHVLSPVRDYAGKAAAEAKASLDRGLEVVKTDLTKQCDEGRLRK